MGALGLVAVSSWSIVISVRGMSRPYSLIDRVDGEIRGDGGDRRGWNRCTVGDGEELSNGGLSGRKTQSASRGFVDDETRCRPGDRRNLPGDRLEPQQSKNPRLNRVNING